MKTLKKLLLGIGLAGIMGFSNLKSSYSQTKPEINQNQDSAKIEKYNPWLDEKYHFKFESIDALEYGSKSNLISSFLIFPEEDYKYCKVYLTYTDANLDGFYEKCEILNSIRNFSPSHPSKGIKVLEDFTFLENEKLDYILSIWKENDYELGNKIITKEYKKITLKEARDIDENFVKRVNEFAKTQEKFSRFNTEPLDYLIREEANRWTIERQNYKNAFWEIKFTKTGFPIYKYFTKEEISKIEMALNF